MAGPKKPEEFSAIAVYDTHESGPQANVMLATQIDPTERTALRTTSASLKVLIVGKHP